MICCGSAVRWWYRDKLEREANDDDEVRWKMMLMIIRIHPKTEEQDAVVIWSWECENAPFQMSRTKKEKINKVASCAYRKSPAVVHSWPLRWMTGRNVVSIPMNRASRIWENAGAMQRKKP
jgi:hypothetical protein